MGVLAGAIAAATGGGVLWGEAAARALRLEAAAGDDIDALVAEVRQIRGMRSPVAMVERAEALLPVVRSEARSTAVDRARGGERRRRLLETLDDQGLLSDEQAAELAELRRMVAPAG